MHQDVEALVHPLFYYLTGYVSDCQGSVEKYWGVFFSFIVFCIFAL